MANDSDALPLELQPRVKIPRPWRRYFETIAVLVALVGGGFGLGFVYASRVDNTEMARLREDHQAEIGRLQEAYGIRLSTLSGQVTNAAETAQSAAQTANSAASTAAAAAEASKKPAR